MKNLTLLNKLFILIAFAFCFARVQGQIVYKIPEGGFPMDWNKSGFKGMLFLQKDSPSGLFIAFPNQGETLDQLRERAAKFIAPMVITVTKDADIPFQIRSIAAHKGDIMDGARYYSFKNEKSTVQILFFERSTPASPVLYGYFAQKDNGDDKSKIWVGEDLRDPKILTKFIESFDRK